MNRCLIKTIVKCAFKICYIYLCKCLLPSFKCITYIKTDYNNELENAILKMKRLIVFCENKKDKHHTDRSDNISGTQKVRHITPKFDVKKCNKSEKDINADTTCSHDHSATHSDNSSNDHSDDSSDNHSDDHSDAHSDNHSDDSSDNRSNEPSDDPTDANESIKKETYDVIKKNITDNLKEKYGENVEIDFKCDETIKTKKTPKKQMVPEKSKSLENTVYSLKIKEVGKDEPKKNNFCESEIYVNTKTKKFYVRSKNGFESFDLQKRSVVRCKKDKYKNMIDLLIQIKF